MTALRSLRSQLTLGLVPVGTFAVLLVSLGNLELCQKFFLHSTYYLHLGLLVSLGGLYARRAGRGGVDAAKRYCAENWPGLLLALLVTAIVGAAVEPSLRLLSDEANLIGTSKNFFSSRSPTFTISGKNYYGTYWDVDVAIDQRPTFFPFSVSLLHALIGYSPENAYLFNLLALPVFAFVVYRLAKKLGGETLGLVGSGFAVCHPILLLSVRSAGFDFFATLLSIVALASTLRFLESRSAEDLAVLWLELCALSSIRYESALFVPPILAVLLFFKLIRRTELRPYAWLYALSPAFLLPRIWLSLLRGNVPKQDPGTITFSLDNFLANTHEYFLPLLDPLGSYPAHSASLLALGTLGLGRFLWLRPDREAKKSKGTILTRFSWVVFLFMTAQAVIVFTYVWGRAQYPSAARLVLSIDVFFSLVAAWFVVRSTRSLPNLVPILLALGLFVSQLPIASQARLSSKLTETRENEEVQRLFRRIGEEQILIVSQRPIHFTIMNYGSMTFEKAKNDPYLFTALDRRLFQEVYLIQHIQLSSGAPLPGYEFWSDRTLTEVHSFQNDANVLVRVSKVQHKQARTAAAPD